MNLDRRHIIELAMLILILLIGIFILLYVPIVGWSRILAVGVAGVYPLWGIWHHLEHRNLSWSIAWEYILVGALAALVLLSIVSD